MANRIDDDDEPEKVKEMYGLEVNHVDAVDKPASGMKFLVIKSEEGGKDLDQLLDEAKKGQVAKAEGEKSDNDKLHDQADARSKKYGIAFKEGKGHLTPPKDKPTDPAQYADPVNYAYPIDSSHIQPAVDYFNHDGMREAGGYTSEEWAIIGKRIAHAAGSGYSYSNGKIVTPSQKEDTKKAEDDLTNVQTQDASVPGSQEWETKDAQLMQEATAGLVALKGLIKEIVKREQAEAMNGEGEDEQVFNLLNALDGITDALKNVAATTAVEEAEVAEGVQKSVSKKVDKETMTKMSRCMKALCKAAGFKGVKDFSKECKCKDIEFDDDEDGFNGDISHDDSGVAPNAEDSKKSTAEKDQGDLPGSNIDKAHANAVPNGDKPQNNQSTTLADTQKSKAGDDKVKDEEKESAKKSASGEILGAEAVIKALEQTGLTKLAKSAGDLLEATKVVKSLEERIKAIEEQPQPGGPVLRGTATANDYYLVRKGAEPNLNDNHVLEQAATQVHDPYIRDVLNREVAKRMHPAARQN